MFQYFFLENRSRLVHCNIANDPFLVLLLLEDCYLSFLISTTCILKNITKGEIATDANPLIFK